MNINRFIIQNDEIFARDQNLKLKVISAIEMSTAIRGKSFSFKLFPN